MKVTITGGAGYIGSTLAEQLLASGHEVRVLDRLLFGQHDVAEALEAMGADVMVGDVREPADRAAALAGLSTWASFTDSTTGTHAVTTGTVEIDLGAAGTAANRLDVDVDNVAPSC